LRIYHSLSNLYIFSWVNDILSRIRQASNSDVYLSILLILLSSFGGPCRQVKRKMWLNLATFASSPDNILRKKAATILAAASTKDQFEDLYNEVLILLDQISPLLLSKKMERPSERTLGTLNDSLLILNQNYGDEEEVEESAEILGRILIFFSSMISIFRLLTLFEFQIDCRWTHMKV
jgi:hypothetical protein